jgi:hypothetical protein
MARNRRKTRAESQAEVPSSEKMPVPTEDEPIPVPPDLRPQFLPDEHVPVYQPDDTEADSPEIRELHALISAKMAALRLSRLAGFRPAFGQPIKPEESLTTIINDLEVLEELKDAQSKGEVLYNRWNIVDQIELIMDELRPIFEHARFRSYCEAVHGTYPRASAARKLLGELKYHHSLSEAEAAQITLDKALDIVSPELSGGVTVRNNQPRQKRMTYDTGGKVTLIYLDGNPLQTFDEIATRYVVRLIDANGERVSFNEFKKKHPGYESTVSSRCIKKIPPELLAYIERDGTRSARLKVELLV